jgi:hypothetical protein
MWNVWTRRASRGRHILSWLALSSALAVALGWAPNAGAQASTWLYLGGGAGVLDHDGRQSLSMVQLDTGVGSAATHPLVVGGLLRVQGYLGSGADLSLLARFVSRGFARGDFGVGVDIGAYQRWWGQNSTGATGNLVLGGPWGLTLVAGAMLGTNDQKLYFGSVGLDLARLTVHRHTGLDWFPNPMRAPAD